MSTIEYKGITIQLNLYNGACYLKVKGMEQKTTSLQTAKDLIDTFDQEEKPLKTPIMSSN